MPRQTGAAKTAKVPKKVKGSASYQKAPELGKARSAKKEDGVHEVITTPEGYSISAEFRNGQFRRWVARDKNGKPAPITFQKAAKPKSARSLELLRPQGGEIIIEVCFLCLRNPLPTGPDFICYQIPCN